MFKTDRGERIFATLHTDYFDIIIVELHNCQFQSRGAPQQIFILMCCNVFKTHSRSFICRLVDKQPTLLPGEVIFSSFEMASCLVIEMLGMIIDH